MAKWKINPHSGIDKSFVIYNEDSKCVELELDYDDVNHEFVDFQAKMICDFEQK